mmetsp:Transcript_19833/g.41722  ORF Transcript_19833/g.41722 Transcript_19833/m.41722 type:complete len:487 (-) Transcript_19833:674-2134(-)
MATNFLHWCSIRQQGSSILRVASSQSSHRGRLLIGTWPPSKRRAIVSWRPSSSFSTATTASNVTDHGHAPPHSTALSPATTSDENATATNTHLIKPPSNAQTLAELTKARLSALVVTTTAFGFLSAGPTAIATSSLPVFFAASVGTALCASSAATFNQVLEADRDKRMKRTAHRPLVTGVVSPEQAAGLGCLAGGAGGALLAWGTDPVTTLLGVGNIGLYAGLYTHMKPRSEWNTWVGAVVGAVPPVMGWTAAGGSVMDPEAMLLGSALFLWQFPHFFALNFMYRKDYERGGFAMVAVEDPNGDRTASLIKRYAWYLSSLPLLSTALEVTSPMFSVEGILLNAYALKVAYKFDGERSNANARKVFLTSLWYLPCLMMLFLLHSRRWHEELKEEEMEKESVSVLVSLEKFIHEIQTKGKELCVHEAIASKEVDVWIGSEKNKTSLDASKCPISLGKAAANTSITKTEGNKIKLTQDNPTKKASAEES